ncbi:hypothetical protein E4U43_000305 [Claviceps pusilla]|uniref:Uncharacterized protein n=1 Tax=Claviceps pusilla TaxID=123648 RepID=A0A9P7SWU0_9HYPO|nr:hypothetical protein E4U43_000305 [Claviceps pusilla]
MHRIHVSEGRERVFPSRPALPAMRSILPSRGDQPPLPASVFLRRRVVNTTRPAITVSVTSSSSTRLDSAKPTNGRVTAHLSVSIVTGFDTNKTSRTFISDMLVKSLRRMLIKGRNTPQLAWHNLFGQNHGSYPLAYSIQRHKHIICFQIVPKARNPRERPYVAEIAQDPLPWSSARIRRFKLRE